MNEKTSRLTNEKREGSWEGLGVWAAPTLNVDSRSVGVAGSGGLFAVLSFTEGRAVSGV